MTEVRVWGAGAAGGSGSGVLPLALVNFGHFTSFRVSGDGTVRGLGLHLERLRENAARVFGVALDVAAIRAALNQLPREEGGVTVRVTVFSPAEDLGHPGRDAEPVALVTTRGGQAAAPAGHPGQSAQQLPPLVLRSVRYQRDDATVKHTGLYGALRARSLAQRGGADDALFVHPAGGAVSEGPTWNVGFVTDDGRVVWPQADVLPGVTMQLLQAGAEFTTREIRPADFGGLRAAFATNAAIGVRPIAAVDGHPFDPDHPALAALRRRYEALPGELL